MKLVRFGHIIEQLDEKLLLNRQPEMTRRRFLKWAFSGTLMLTGSTALNLLRVESAWADRFGGPVDVHVPLIEDSFWGGFSSGHSVDLTNPPKERIGGFPLANKQRFDHFLRCWAVGERANMDQEMLLKLAKLDWMLRRYSIRSPINIHSAFRTTEHNSRVAGATNSQHVYRTAFDADVPGLSPGQLSWCAYQAGFQWVGINTRKNFVHADTRPSNRQTVFFYT